MGVGAGQIGSRPASLTASAVGCPASPFTDIRLLALAFLAGLAVLHALPQLPALLGLVPLLLLALLRFPQRPVYLSFVLALVWGSLQGHWILADRLGEAEHGDIRWVQGHVAGLPETQGRRTRFEFIGAERPRRIRVSWYGDAPPIDAGACWRLKLNLSAPRGSANPGGFDYEAWLWRQRISASGYVREAERCVPDHNGLDRQRQRLGQHLQAALDEHASAGVIRALLLGDRGGISDRQWQVFRQTGTSHLMAISGLHVGLVAAVGYYVFYWFCAGLGRPRRVPFLLVASVGSILVAGGYAALSGFALPAKRAFIAISVVALALLLRRSMLSSQLLALALLAVLLFDPFALLAPGFWLSFAAVGWIVYLLAGRVGARPRLYAFLLLQPMLMCALAPLTLFWFGEASAVGPLVNTLLIPLFGLLLPLLFVGAALYLLWPALGGELLGLLAWLMDSGLAALDWAAGLPMAHVQLPQPAIWEVALASLALLLLFSPRGLPLRWVALIGLLPLLVGPVRPATGAFEATVLDVGQGLSVFVQTARHDLLFDAGPRYPGGFDAGEAIVSPFLASRGIGRLDLLVQSHDDIDHRGGVAAVTQRFRPRQIIGAAGGEPCRAGQRWIWDGVVFEMLHPRGDAFSGNNASCVLRVSTAGGRSLLLTGDIERVAERALVLRSANLASDVLLLPHHGSATSSSQGFLAAVSPRLALVSAGWRNRWDFPRPEVEARLVGAAVPLLNTAESGAIRVYFPADGEIKTERWRAHARHFWRALP